MMRQHHALSVAVAVLGALTACEKPQTPSQAVNPPAERAVLAPSQVSPAVKPAPANEPQVEPVEIIVWHAYRAGEKAAIEATAASWNRKRPDIHVRLQAVPYDPFVDKISITVPRGQGPDVFIFAHNMIGTWVEEGVLEPLSAHVPTDALSAFAPKSVKALVYQKNLYGLPLALKSLVLFYNKSLMAEAPKTMEALIAEAKRVQTEREGVHGLVYEAGLLYNHAVWVHAFGGEVLNSRSQPMLSSQPHLEAATFVRDLHHTHKIVPKGITGFMVTSLFNEGSAVAVLSGPWFRPEIAAELDYGVATIPTVGGKKSRPFLGVEAVFVSAQSTHKAAAVEVARHLAGAESASFRMTMGKQPVAHLETLRSSRDPAMAVFTAQAEEAVIMPASPEMQVVWSAADMAINAIVFGGRDAQETMTKAQARALRDIEKRGQ